ncbi:hypothetical protein A6U87_27820 [Rhizobium sp. AC44/96]|uniref:hypothetical protein n=1 Tax=unclassified Rhizobium TaxID=2613769 RepID=UPI00080F9011|nr:MULTISPECIES: hypothetical protein [unclassified Rhizobium]MDM9623444.1 hypothetical protein [Rhizobium sp. S96]OCJ11123.1 hypothetical protein A6U87_27820 [Rhizobium sp. AC44/96]
MLPKFVTAFLKSSGNQGVVVMEHDGTHRVIVVDQEALREMSNPPRADETRLQQSIGAICEIATTKILRGGRSPHSRIAVSASDVAAWKLDQSKLH